MGAKTNQITINLIKSEYLQGKTILEIENSTNLSGVCIRDVLKRLGIYKSKQNKDLIKYGTSLNFFNKIDSEEKAYWLGFIYADGCVVGASNKYAYRFCVDLAIKDFNHLQKLANIFNTKLTTKIRSAQICQSQEIKDFEIVNLTINNKTIWSDLQQNGISIRKTLNPDLTIFDKFDKRLMNHFIRGVFDGDGSIIKDSNMFIMNGNKDFLETVQKILISEINLNLTKIFLDKGNGYKLYYGGREQIKRIFDWLYNNAITFLERKKAIFEEIIYDLNAFKLNQTSKYKGVSLRSNGTWLMQANINSKLVNHTYDTDLEAAYRYDLEQVRQRGETAKQFMNFPEQYLDFVEWVKQGNNI